MPGELRKFEIKLITTADPSGARQTAQGLQDVGKATEQASEHAEGMNKNSREMRKLFGEIDRIVPGLGESLKGLFEPEAAGIIAGIVGLELLMKAFEKWKKQQEEAAALSAALWQAQFDGINKAMESAEAYDQVINRLPSSLEKITTQYSAAKTILDEQVKAHKTILEDLEKEEIAAAKGDQSKEDAIRRRYAAAGRGNDLAGESEALNQLRLELKTLVSTEFEAKRQSLIAEANKEDAQRDTEEVTRAKKYIEQNQSKFAEDNEYLEKNGGVEKAREEIQHQRDTHHGQDTIFSQQLEEMIESVDKFKAAQQTIADWDDHVKQAAEKAAQTLKSFEELRTKVQQLNEQIDTAQHVLDIHKQTAQKQNAFDAVDKAGGFENADNIIAGGVAAQAAILNGKKVDQHMAEQIQAMNALFQTVGGNSILIVQILRQSLASHKSQEQEIAALKVQFANLKGAASRNSPTGQ